MGYRWDIDSIKGVETGTEQNRNYWRVILSSTRVDPMLFPSPFTTSRPGPVLVLCHRRCLVPSRVNVCSDTGQCPHSSGSLFGSLQTIDPLRRLLGGLVLLLLSVQVLWLVYSAHGSSITCPTSTIFQFDLSFLDPLGDVWRLTPTRLPTKFLYWT